MSAVILEKKGHRKGHAMESQYWNDEVQQSAWLLDYDRRCMLDCADTFQNLAAVMGEMNWELEQEKTPDDRKSCFGADRRWRAGNNMRRICVRWRECCSR